MRNRTDNLLINAENYPDYQTWDDEMTALIHDWSDLEKQVHEMETTAGKKADELAVNRRLIGTVYAYTSKEVTDIYDKAPKFKGIATLAKHLGVDAKRAQLILNQAQDETTAEVFIEEGDAFENLEHKAIVVKDGCKVVGFVGGVVLTGGTAGLAAAGTIAQAGTVVVGVDLALEVTEDGAQIAFGDRNKISSIVKDVRTVTEPIASVITITNVPGNLGNAYGKFDSVMVGLEQFRETAQEGKVVGVDLTTFEYHPPFQRIRQAKYPGTVTVAEIEKAEVEAWLQSLNKKYEPMTEEEVKEFLVSSSNENKGKKESEVNTKSVEESEKKSEKKSLANTAWEGTVESISGGNEEKQRIEFDFVLNEDGTVNGGNFKKWTQEGDRIKIFGEDESKGYFEFKVGENDLLLTEMRIGDEVIQPGEKYMGGIAPWGFLYKKSGSKEGDSQSGGDAMPISEYNEMDEDGDFKNIALVTEKLGEPDVKTTDENGRIVYVYYDLVKYDSGNMGSVKMAFYNEADYRSYVTDTGGSWESNKETWDESGGGIRANSEVKPGDTLKKRYGQ
ncbi:hypothetical protein IPM65_01950 [Candidatus Roizmanbacteria bacterium]|nr:MAG: hypothetical protein IPM65_01950 [Candidatus Roizmanbacteria bacterium]